MFWSGLLQDHIQGKQNIAAKILTMNLFYKEGGVNGVEGVF